MTARDRIEQERDATRQSIDDPALTTHQQDMAAARAWAYGHVLQIIDEDGDGEPAAAEIVADPRLLSPITPNWPF